MTDDGRSGGGISVQVVVAVIGLISAVTVAVVANWDKLFPDSVQSAARLPTPPQGTNDRTLPAADTASVGTAGQQVALEREVADEAATLAVLPSLSGSWRDQAGTVYVMTQSGAQLAFQFAGGGIVGGGDGMVDGTAVATRYQNSLGDAGTCNGVLSPTGRIIEGTCNSAFNGPYPFRIYR